MTDQEIVLITGANSGIGLATVQQLVESDKPYYIYLGSRTPSKADQVIADMKEVLEKSKSTVEPVQIDVTDDESINKAVELVQAKFGKLDVLINNAGASFDTTFANDAATGNFRSVFNKAYDVNVTGAQVMTASFAPLLIKSASPRLLFLTSGTSTLQGAFDSFMPPWGPKPPGGWPKENMMGHQGYKSCKAALNMAMLTWYWILKEDGVRTWAISPGFLATNISRAGPDFLRKAGAGEPVEGGELIRKVVEGERDADVGKIVTKNGVQPW